MHEFSITTQLVDSVLQELKKYDVKKVNEVYIEIGELTFLAHEQVKFAYEILTKDNILKDSKLVIKERKTVCKCSACGYEGSIEYENDEAHHFSFPKLCCPKCGSDIEIIKGKDCVVKNIKAVVENV